MIERVDVGALYPERRLFLDIVSGQAAASRWLPGDEAVRARREASAPASAELVRSLCDYHRPLTDSPETFEHIDALGEPGTLCVVAGQQAGFLGGALLTAHKIISAIRAANEIGRALNARVVPVFWLASEDHDLDEIRRVRYVDENGDLRTASFDWSGRGRPIEAMPSGPAAEAAKAVRAALGLSDPVWSAFQPEAGDDYSRWHARIWLRRFRTAGLVVVEPRIVRPFTGEIVARAISVQSEITADLRDRAAQLQRDGYDLPLDPAEVGGVFIFDESGRRVRPTGEVRPGDARRTPERFSPDVALRPIVADALLPTAANLLGPSEMEYHTMLAPIYRRLDVLQPAAIPRSGFTLVGASEVALLDRLGVRAGELLSGGVDLVRCALGAADPGISARCAEVESETQRALAPLEALVTGIDPGLAARFRQVRDRTSKEIQSLAERAIRADLARRGISTRTARVVSALVRPAGQPQERILSVISAAGRYGLEWTDRLVEIASLEPGAHYVIEVP